MIIKETVDYSNFKSYFILRGNNEHLARGELRALLEIYDPKALIICYTMICLATTTPDKLHKVIRRAGYVKEAGSLLSVYSAYSIDHAKNASSLLRDKSVHVSIMKSTIREDTVKQFLNIAGLKPSYRGIGEQRLIFTDGVAILGRKIEANDFSKQAGDSKAKPFNRSIALKPDISRVLVNLTRAREGSIIIDPFAGTGSVLIEAWRMGILAVGVDVDWNLTKGMEYNLEYFKIPSIVILSDSRYLSFREVDHVATDLPYGRGASTHGVELRELYKDFMEKLSDYLSKSGYACFMTPLWLEEYVDELISAYGFKLTERYYDYAHGSLTRTINVVRKW
ncbi:MAG: RNA methyltransferase [Desulfurococcaceae archaeon]